MKFNAFIRNFKFALVGAAFMTTISAFAGDCNCNCEIDWVKVEEGQCSANNHGCSLPVPAIKSFDASACDLCLSQRIMGSEWNGDVARSKGPEQQKALCFAASGSQDPEVARKWNGKLKIKGKRHYPGSHTLLCGRYTDDGDWMRTGPDDFMDLDCQKVFADMTPCKNGGTGTSKADCARGVFGGTDPSEALHAAGAANGAMAQVAAHVDNKTVNQMDATATGNMAVAGGAGSLPSARSSVNPAQVLSGLQVGGRVPGSGGGAGGASASGSGGSLSGELLTDSGNTSGVDPNSQLTVGGVDGSTYSGVAGGLGKGNGKAGSPGFGGFGSEGGSGAANQINLGRDPASVGSDGMKGEDPEDYFMRIGASESLFKKVETRYRVKSIHWAKSNLAEMK